MKRWRYEGWFTALSLLCSPAFAEGLDGKMDVVAQAYADTGWFMGTVLAARDGKVLLDKGYGSADLEWNISNTPDVKFRLGSVTKQFTAAAILLLEQQGKLSTNDPVGKYLPDAPAAWAKVTIYSLLTHTSGIPNFTSFPDYKVFERQPTNAAELVARFRDKPLDFEPGAKMSYSNSGYALLGYLIEKVSGESYSAFLQEKIFTPLGMSDTGYDFNAKLLTHRAHGYSPGEAGPVNTGYIDMTVPFAAGGLYSTTHDLMTWETGLFGGKILSAAALAKMTTPFKQDYGCGLSIKTERGHRVIAHGGGIEGFNTELRYYPDDKLLIVVLANLNGDAPDKIADGLADVAWGKTPNLPTVHQAVTLDPAVLDRYVGYYQMSPTVIAAIARRGDHLYSRLTGQEWIELFAENEHTFFLKVVDAEVTFAKDGTGQVAYLTVLQGGRDHAANRIDEKTALSVDKDAAAPMP